MRDTNGNTEPEQNTAPGQASRLLLLTDAHAHVDTLEEARERIRERIPTLLCAANPEDVRRIQPFLSLPGAENFLIPTYGLHPWHSAAWTVPEMADYLKKGEIIGEIGMDRVWCTVPLPIQRRVFEEQLRLACELKKPVILHTKGQEAEIAELLRGYPNQYLVHWYSCDQFLERYLEQDCYVSIGPDVFWNPAVQEAARRVPMDRILMETDGLSAVHWAISEAPEEAQGEWERWKKDGGTDRAPLSARESLEYTLKTVSRLRGVPEGELLARTEKNFRSFLGGCPDASS